MHTLDAGGAAIEFVDIDSGVPVILYLDVPGCCSVTNAPEAVVPVVVAKVRVMGGQPLEVIVYRDSTGQFDGLLVGEKDRFAGYPPLGGARSHDEALARLPQALAALRPSVSVK
ncbi:hypothetical protein [Paraburkholderia sp. BR14320]|uniref:hypothetical protein n=1 Tax=unclassified Paraburkholderia TaxID=2615204 RepID=UPI0034CE3237